MQYWYWGWFFPVRERKKLVDEMIASFHSLSIYYLDHLLPIIAVVGSTYTHTKHTHFYFRVKRSCLAGWCRVPLDGLWHTYKAMHSFAFATGYQMDVLCFPFRFYFWLFFFSIFSRTENLIYVNIQLILDIDKFFLWKSILNVRHLKWDINKNVN